MARKISPKDDDPPVVIANSGGVLKLKGIVYQYRPGQAFPIDHPLVRAIPKRFGPIRVMSGARVPPEIRGLPAMPEVVVHEIAED